MDDGEDCDKGQKEEVETKKWKVHLDPSHEYDGLGRLLVFLLNFEDITFLNYFTAGAYHTSPFRLRAGFSLVIISQA